MQIINSDSEENKEIKLIPEMLNFLGCNKDNFKKLIQKMNYKILEKNDEIFFKYIPKKDLRKSPTKNFILKENPFACFKKFKFKKNMFFKKKIK